MCTCNYRHSTTQSIACSYKAVTGYLYPLARGFIFVPKPPVHVRFDEVESVNFARSAGNTRSFDFDITTLQGSTFTFVGIEKWVALSLYKIKAWLLMRDTLNVPWLLTNRQFQWTGNGHSQLPLAELGKPIFTVRLWPSTLTYNPFGNLAITTEAVKCIIIIN